MNHSIFPCRRLAGLFSLLIFAFSLAHAADAPTSDNAAAILAITPRTNLPPAADDPASPAEPPAGEAQRWAEARLHRLDRRRGERRQVGPYLLTYHSYCPRVLRELWSNYDEAKANPYPLLPNPLVLKNGQPVNGR